MYNKLITTITISIFLIICASLVYSKEIKNLVNNIIIFKKPDAYAAFPYFFKTDDGSLVVKFNIRPKNSHYASAEGKTFVSKDNGITWKESSVMFLDPAYRNNSNKYVMPYGNGWKEASANILGKLQENGVLVNESGGKKYFATGAYLKISSDNGKTWEHKEIKLPPHALLMTYNASSYIRTSKNIRLFSLYGKINKHDPDTVFFLRSSDDGNTWLFHKMYSTSPDTPGFNETCLVETTQGDIVAIMRPSPDSFGYLFTAVSKDGGISWSIPRKTSIWGYPANAIRLKDGRIFCCYGYRKEPMGIRGGILKSDFSGIVGNELIIRNDAKIHPAHVGYPMAVELDNSKVAIVYYITNDDGVTHIAESIIVP